MKKRIWHRGSIRQMLNAASVIATIVESSHSLAEHAEPPMTQPLLFSLWLCFSWFLTYHHHCDHTATPCSQSVDPEAGSSFHPFTLLAGWWAATYLWNLPSPTKWISHSCLCASITFHRHFTILTAFCFLLPPLDLKDRSPCEFLPVSSWLALSRP